MNIESQVTSLELSKKLKELGVKQESLFYWILDTIGTRYDIPTGLSDKFCSAYTASELLEMLPTNFEFSDQSCENVFLEIKKYPHEYSVRYFDHDDKWFNWHLEEDPSICNALAKMLIHLIENKLVEF